MKKAFSITQSAQNNLIEMTSGDRFVEPLMESQ